MTLPSSETVKILAQVLDERVRQNELWGRQDHPVADAYEMEDAAGSLPGIRDYCDLRTAEGRVTWSNIVEEELFEALAEQDADKRRIELIQLAAVVVAAIEAEDRRYGRTAAKEGR